MFIGPCTLHRTMSEKVYGASGAAYVLAHPDVAQIVLYENTQQLSRELDFAYTVTKCRAQVVDVDIVQLRSCTRCCAIQQNVKKMMPLQAS